MLDLTTITNFIDNTRQKIINKLNPSVQSLNKNSYIIPISQEPVGYESGTIQDSPSTKTRIYDFFIYDVRSIQYLKADITRKNLRIMNKTGLNLHYSDNQFVLDSDLRGLFITPDYQGKSALIELGAWKTSFFAGIYWPDNTITVPQNLYFSLIEEIE